MGSFDRLASETATFSTNSTGTTTVTLGSAAGIAISSTTANKVETTTAQSGGGGGNGIITITATQPFTELRIKVTALAGNIFYMTTRSATTATATVAVQKTTVGGFGGPFSFTQSNLASTPASITTTAADTATASTSGAINVTTTGQAVALTETPVSGYTLTSASCVDSNAATSGNTAGAAYGSLSGNTLTIPAANVLVGAAFVCTFTNTKLPTVTIKKISTGGLATFNFTGDNGFGSDAVTTTTLGSAATGVTKTLTATATTTTITEAAVTGYTMVGASCTGMGAGGNATVDTTARTVVLDAAATAAGSNIVCTFTNSTIPLPTVTIKKISNGGTGTYSFSGDNGFGSDSITTTSSGTAASGATKTLTAAGVATTLTETIPASSSLAGAVCTGMGTGGAATVNASAGTVLLDAAATAAGSNIVCTFTNTVAAAGGPNIILSKAGPATGVVGNALPYTISLGNSGTGSSGTTLTVSDKLPAGVSAYSAIASTGVSSVSCTNLNVAGALLTCTVKLKAALSSGSTLGTAKFTINTRASAAGSIVNYASVDPTSGAAPPTPSSSCSPAASCGSASTVISAKKGSSYW